MCGLGEGVRYCVGFLWGRGVEVFAEIGSGEWLSILAIDYSYEALSD